MIKQFVNSYFPQLNLSKIVIFAVVLLLCDSCKKQTSCYDEQLYLQHKDDMCTMDCPGVTGCDGKSYCNECEANRQGIRIK